jgi:hypothetical protein
MTTRHPKSNVLSVFFAVRRGAEQLGGEAADNNQTEEDASDLFHGGAQANEPR